ncbi:unnamed protein product [Pedinophyceae sp. YPF-701]|nr:unnamed protein product [Pedinophyceae sp. YPF-701]
MAVAHPEMQEGHVVIDMSTKGSKTGADAPKPESSLRDSAAWDGRPSRVTKVSEEEEDPNIMQETKAEQKRRAFRTLLKQARLAMTVLSIGLFGTGIYLGVERPDFRVLGLTGWRWAVFLGCLFPARTFFRLGVRGVLYALRTNVFASIHERIAYFVDPAAPRLVLLLQFVFYVLMWRYFMLDNEGRLGGAYTPVFRILASILVYCAGRCISLLLTKWFSSHFNRKTFFLRLKQSLRNELVLSHLATPRKRPRHTHALRVGSRAARLSSMRANVERPSLPMQGPNRHKRNVSWGGVQESALGTASVDHPLPDKLRAETPPLTQNGARLQLPPRAAASHSEAGHEQMRIPRSESAQSSLADHAQLLSDVAEALRDAPLRGPAPASVDSRSVNEDGFGHTHGALGGVGSGSEQSWMFGALIGPPSDLREKVEAWCQDTEDTLGTHRQVEQLERYVRKHQLGINFGRNLKEARILTDSETLSKVSKRFARFVFENVRSPDKKAIDREDVARVLPATMVDEAMELLDKARKGHATRHDTLAAVTAVLKERVDLSNALRDTRSIVGTMGRVVATCTNVVVVFIALAIFQVQILELWLTFATMGLAFTFVFGNTLKNLFESALLLFATHPFDVGDAIIVEGQMYFVQEIALLRTHVKHAVGSHTWIPNHVLNGMTIVNLSRSDCRWEPFEVAVDVDIDSVAVREAFEERLKEVVKDKPHYFTGEFFVRWLLSSDTNKVKLALWFGSANNGSDLNVSGEARNLMFEGCMKILKDMGIRPGVCNRLSAEPNLASLIGPTAATTPPPPAAAGSDGEAMRNGAAAMIHSVSADGLRQRR